ncbi:hypothetical protein Bhyg_15970 [Pseudolycoriella hygida]|uniref:Uncharacterized protein n=1 Tax=Pseudolycoriella hygida TaxID=35572 RepID=A0A9Q0RVL8_9DIPT|nr:hypothetical protein Bhyg_15970 [Pseudolycoriella hygida]
MEKMSDFTPNVQKESNFHCLHSIDSTLQEELNRFKEIQKNPQLLHQTLSELERERRRRDEKSSVLAVELHDEEELTNSVDPMKEREKRRLRLCRMHGCTLKGLHCHSINHTKIRIVGLEWQKINNEESGDAILGGLNVIRTRLSK